MGFRKNYHGGRTYAAEPDDETGLAGWLRSKLRSLFRYETAAKATSSPPRPNGSPYSILGADDQGPFPPHSGRPVFPMADWSARSNTSLRSRRRAAHGESAGVDHPRQ